MTLALFGLLTRLKLSRTVPNLAEAARSQFLFPLVGAVVGLIATVAALAFWIVLGKDLAMISAAGVMLVLYYINGVLHTEGLADFSDGVMASGTQQEKRAAMKDAHAGVAAVLSVVFYVLLLFVLLTEICEEADERLASPIVGWLTPVAIGLVMAEVSGKIAMNTSMRLGPSSHEGMGSLFVREASQDRFVVSLIIAGIIAFACSGLLFPLVFLGAFAGIGVTLLARKHFGGVAGDSFGAANEVGRLLTLSAWVFLT